MTEPGSIGKPKKFYEVGTLRYDTRGLVVLFSWLLWGDFAFCFFESIFGRFIPLYLNDLKASNTLIGIMTGSIAGAVNILFLPGISRWSDEFRSKWGRRIPFLAMATPITVGSLMLMGFAPEIGGWVHSRVVFHINPAISQTTVILTLLCGFVVSFHYFNMVLCNAVQWLIRDVVPQEFMARFLSWMRMVSTVAGVAFSWYIFPYVISHRKEVCVGIGLFYTIVFLLMCLKIKEGEYPPPPPKSANPPGMFKNYMTYFRDCLSIPLYRNYFLSGMIGCVAGCSYPFMMLFYTKTLNVGMGDLGKIFAVSGVVQAVVLPFWGWFCDRVSPFRVAIGAATVMFLLTFLSFFFINGMVSLLVFSVLGAAISAGGGVAGGTMTMELFPTEKFGQFFAATNIFNCGILIVGNYLIGFFMDMVHSNYRMAIVWSWMGGLGLIPLLMVYRDWKKFGGPHNYVAPLPPE